MHSSNEKIKQWSLVSCTTRNISLPCEWVSPYILLLTQIESNNALPIYQKLYDKTISCWLLIIALAVVIVDLVSQLLVDSVFDGLIKEHIFLCFDYIILYQNNFESNKILLRFLLSSRTLSGLSHLQMKKEQRSSTSVA